MKDRIMKNKVFYLSLLLLIFAGAISAQQKTDVSLFFKKDRKQLNEVSSSKGNLFLKLGHHGPAVENPWLAFRFYFDKKAAIDIYSKEKPGLEIREKQWYPSKKDQRTGWGADYYKVGKSVGLGGIRLWDGEELIALHPVTNRSARVAKESDRSYMEILSEGVPYKGGKVDILVRVTVFPDKREALVEAESVKGGDVRFATGINYFKNLKVYQADSYIATWGIHPEDVAAEKVEIGAAILFNPDDYNEKLDDGKQHLLISKPTSSLRTRITSVNAREAEINTYQKFLDLLDK